MVRNALPVDIRHTVDPKLFKRLLMTYFLKSHIRYHHFKFLQTCNMSILYFSVFQMTVVLYYIDIIALSHCSADIIQILTAAEGNIEK